MRYFTLIIFLILVGLARPAIATEQYVVDSNAVLFEGDSLNYILLPPPGFKLETAAAQGDGLSLAFIPDADTYDSAAALIGLTFMRLGPNAFGTVVEVDTTAIRRHYGEAVSITLVDSIANFHGERVKTFYIDDDRDFIPTVMVSYYDGGHEILIAELVVSETGLPRFMAEELYVSCLQRFRVIKRGRLENAGR